MSGVEIKCPYTGTKGDLWRSMLDDIIPRHYYWQLVHQALVLDLAGGTVPPQGYFFVYRPRRGTALHGGERGRSARGHGSAGGSVVRLLERRPPARRHDPEPRLPRAGAALHRGQERGGYASQDGGRAAQADDRDVRDEASGRTSRHPGSSATTSTSIAPSPCASTWRRSGGTTPSSISRRGKPRRAPGPCGSSRANENRRRGTQRGQGEDRPPRLHPGRPRRCRLPERTRLHPGVVPLPRGRQPVHGRLRGAVQLLRLRCARGHRRLPPGPLRLRQPRLGAGFTCGAARASPPPRWASSARPKRLSPSP